MVIDLIDPMTSPRPGNQPPLNTINQSEVPSVDQGPIRGHTGWIFAYRAMKENKNTRKRGRKLERGFY